MDFNRPSIDPINDGRESANETPDDLERAKSAKSSKSVGSDKKETIQEDAEETENPPAVDEVEITTGEVPAEENNATVNEMNESEINPENEQTNLNEETTLELNETILNDQTNDVSNLDENLSYSVDQNETTEQNDSTQIVAANETIESEMADTSEIKDDKESKAKELQAQHKKEVHKRKHKHNRFADGNLILEEEDDQDYERIVKSPGPPPLEPISQVMDDNDKAYHQKQKHDAGDLLRVQSPDKMDLTLDEDYQEVEIETKPTREELIAKYQSVIEERERLQNANNQLHHKLADYFRKKKSDEAQNQPLFDKSSQEQEQRYLKYLAQIESLKKQIESNRIDAEMELDEIKLKCEMREEMVEKERINFIKVKKDAGVRSISGQTGRPLTLKDIEFHLERERQKEREVIAVRIENIKLKNQLKKKEAELKAKEEFGEGLHMIDFEQLKIENQTYNEKIEERNEELMKLKKKINNTVQILTHVKEKLKFVNSENEKEKSNLSVYDEQVKKNRDILNKMKQSRDSLRMDNGKLKQNSGLLGNTVLLRDFEDCVDKNDEMESKIEQLKRRHAELILNSRGIKNKISETKNDNF